MPVMRHLNVGGTTYDTVGEASVTQVLSSGTKIATVSIDGTSTDLYAPEGGSSVDPATAAPSMDGTAAVGSSAKYAREDHVHPHDTSRLSGVILNTSSEPYNVPVANSSATIYIGDGLSVSDSNDRITLKAKTGTTSDTVAAGNHTHSGYQATLVSGTNIKTINNESLLGSGNISTPTYTLPTASTSTLGGVKVDGTTITAAADGTISAVDGGQSVDPATSTPAMDGTAAVGSSAKYAREDHVHPTDTSRQATLVSGTNIKTVNGNSLLGSGDLTVSGSVSMDDTAVDAAVAAAFGVEVTVSLTNPISPSSFLSCYIEGASDGTAYPEHTTTLGTIDSPTGSTTVTLPSEYPYLGVLSNGTSVSSGTASCTGGVTYLSTPSSGHDVFSVSSSGTITIDGTDYND